MTSRRVQTTLKNAGFLSKYSTRKRSLGSDGRPVTHASMIGGSYNVPLERRGAFRNEYFGEFVRWLTELAVNPLAGPRLFLTERYNNEFFRFFVDIDYEWDQIPPNILESFERIRDAVTNIVEYMDANVYDNGILEMNPSSRTSFKRHIVFPEIIVTVEYCKLFAQAVQKRLNETCELDIQFDMKVYDKGSLRMLGSCKRTGLVPEHADETEFFYMPVDLVTGERRKTIIYDEFERHGILLDKETHDRVEAFAGNDDGDVYLPSDSSHKDNLYVISKCYRYATLSGQTHSSAYLSVPETTERITDSHPLYRLLKDKYGELYAATAAREAKFYNTGESLTLSFSTRECPFIGREHRSNHPRFILNRRGACMKCYSTNDERCRGRFNVIEFKDLGEEVQRCFLDHCLESVVHEIPEVIFSLAKDACERNMASYNCISGGDTTNEPLAFVNGKFVTHRRDCYLRCASSDDHKDVEMETGPNGLFVICKECGSRYPNDSRGLMKDDCSEVLSSFFALIEAFKVRGRSVFQEIDVGVIGDGINECEDDRMARFSKKRCRLLHEEMMDDCLRVFDDDEKNHAFILSMSCTDRDVALFMQFELGDDFVATNADKGEWYCFEAPRWRGGDYASGRLFKFIDGIVEEYIRAITWYRNGGLGREDRIKKIQKVMDKLGDMTFMKKVMSRLAHFRLDVNFLSTLDQNRTLLGFNDGVFDLITHEFRPGCPEDRLSMTVGYNFPATCDPDTCNSITQFFTEIQPDEENRAYLCTFLSTLIDGRTRDELFHIFSGKTRNGKSLLVDMIKMALGSRDVHLGGECMAHSYTYAGDYEPSFLTKERKGSSEPVPDLLANRMARALIGTEPETGDKINASSLKKFTGNDTLTGRLLHSNIMIAFKPQFKLIFVCNDIPDMNYNDDAVWCRARVIDFPVTFVDNPSGPFERKIDRNLKEKICNLNWASNFMYLLLQWHVRYTESGLVAPPSVLRATRQYEEESNLVLQWWNERTEYSSTHVSSKDLLTDFRTHTNNPHVSLKELNKGLKQIRVTVKKAVRTIEGVFTGVENRAVVKSHSPASVNDCDGI